MNNIFNELKNDYDTDENDDSGSAYDNSDGEQNDSDNDIKLEITEYTTGKERIHTYDVSCGSIYSNKKRLLCFSVINGKYCNYGNHCTFAHTLSEQVINIEKFYIYQIILDKNLMNFFSLTNPKTDEIYKQLLFFTHICSKCISSKCMGGYNCKFGTHSPCLKICKNDLLTGECINKPLNISVDESVLNKIDIPTKPIVYGGCINGHHLTKRNLIPYYKYVNQKELSKKTTYQSVRHINLDRMRALLETNTKKPVCEKSSESTDDEINQWFKADDCSSISSE